MPKRWETLHPHVAPLVAGWFRERHRYSAWRPGGTADWLLVLTLTGRGRFGFPGGEIISAAGDLVLLRPGTLHDYGLERKHRRWELLWAHFHPRPNWINWLNWPEVSPGLMLLRTGKRQERSRIQRRFADVVTLASSAGRRRDELAMNALEEVLLWCDAVNPTSQMTRIDPRVQAVMDHVCPNLAAPLSLDSMADACGLSVSRMAHLFRLHARTTPQQFLELQRINRARQLLELTAMSVKEISAEVGYQSPFYFSLRFKRHLGVSPRRFRSVAHDGTSAAHEVSGM